jgi:hypothetical protein
MIASFKREIHFEKGAETALWKLFNLRLSKYVQKIAKQQW